MFGGLGVRNDRQMKNVYIRTMKMIVFMSQRSKRELLMSGRASLVDRVSDRMISSILVGKQLMAF